MIKSVVTTGSSAIFMEHKKTDMTRGVLAKKSGVNSETIRYYEKMALMPDPNRSEGGHRLYKEEHLRRLNFIRRSRELGFSLHEIHELLNLVDDKTYTCSQVQSNTIDHLKDIKEKIRDLKKMERTLKTMISECDGRLTPKCPIIDSLFA